ncbi:voltage-gated hydrogen channel 1-like isoform X2 [Ornithodoros turicata]|uniref:voltage-gated hydrogen channel 1-like isoform X2 n=1 Tax=Ornithodoros turicata TaxID=34597 RepID=UPI0031388C9B
MGAGDLHEEGIASQGRNKPSPSFVSIDMDMESDPEIRPLVTFREKLSAVLHSTKFQIAIVVLVIIDCLLVVTELLVEVEILKLHEKSHIVPKVIHYLSITILSLFLVEIAAKLYAYRLRFFKHKMEMFDAVVVIVSFALDVAFRNPDSGANAGGLIIVLRLWRVARLLNGIVMTVKSQAEHRLAREVKLREKVLQDFLKSRDYCNALEQEIASLRKILESSGIHDLPPTAVEMDNDKDSRVHKSTLQVH